MIDVPRCIGRTKGGLNSKLHAIVDAAGRPVMMCLTEGQTSDHIGARILYPTLPEGTRTLIGDKGYDSDDDRKALSAKGITPGFNESGAWLQAPIITVKQWVRDNIN